MSFTESASNVLEEKFTHAILISLHNKNIQKKTTLLSEISHSSCIGKRIDSLEAAGLIKITIDRFNKNTKWVELTETGATIAKHIIEIGKILSGSD
jgi:hypothetical protein